MTRLERRAALLVAAAAAGVAAYGVRLAKKRARYLVEKAAAAFRDDEVSEPETDAGQSGAESGLKTAAPEQEAAKSGPETAAPEQAAADSGLKTAAPEQAAAPETSEN